MRFLVVNVPYHSDYSKVATDKVFEIDLKRKELWMPQELAIPIFRTGDGGRYVDYAGVCGVFYVMYCSRSLFSLRFGFAQDYYVPHPFAVRPDVYFASTLAQGDRFP